MHGWHKHLGLILGVVLIAGLIALGFMPQPVAVDVAVVSRGRLQVTVEEEGKTRVIDRYVVSAPVAGFKRRIDLNVGDAVLAGQTVVVLEPLRSSVLDPRSRAESEARVSAARATVQASEEITQSREADATLADSELARIRQLFERKMLALDEMQRAEADARRTRAALQSARFSAQVARHELQSAEAVLRYSAAAGGKVPSESVPITAPVDGRVLKIIHESEGVVGAGEALIEIGDPLSLEVEVDVLSRDAVQMAPGTRVRFERWGGNGALDAVVRTVEPVGFTKISALGVEEQRVLVIVDFTSPVEHWQRLGDGYRVDALFILWEGADVLHAPTSALFRHGEHWAAFVVEDNRAVLREVRIGHRGGLSVELLDGVAEGSRVITHPSDAIKDGVRVHVR
jgi:HlyD family secretion protein